MKNILLILAIAFSSSSFSQGNLQFNQVINQVFNGVAGGYFVAGTITVPSGKVWKIESASLIRTDVNPPVGAPVSSSGSSLVIGNHVCYYMNVPEQAVFPIWLSEGTYNVGGYFTLQYRASISAIEFNVVP